MFSNVSRTFLHTAFLLLPTLLAGTSLAQPSPEDTPLELGYRQMYNLNFVGAHMTFGRWQQSHPDDPMGFVSDGAAYLFSEFDRLHVLESELFTNDQKFESRKKETPDPALKAAFDADLSAADRLSANMLSHSPNNHDAMFAQIMANGLRGDYAAMIEKRNLAGLGYMKTGRAQAEKLLQQDPHYYDAYLAIGVENYLLGITAAPVRWFLRLGGAQTNKQQGIDRLKLTAAKGHYLAPYARLLLAVAALRDKDRSTARQLLAGLSQEFPQNRLYALELRKVDGGS